MTALADAPAQTGAEIATYTPAVMDEYRPRIVMAPEEAHALDEALRANMKAVLREGVDYGVIPGTGTKPTLLKPGAEKLLQWFGFGHATEVTETERDGEGHWQGVTYRCTVTKAMPDGRSVEVAMCEGYAGYDEDRFFLSADAATAKERANAERYKRPVNAVKCAEYRAPRNSVMKMAQKRALVGAALQATSASTLFTQDLEDTEPAVTPSAALANAAKGVILGLADEVRSALDDWYRSQKWPEPGNWDAEQWCAALVQAGRLSTGAVSQDTAAPPADSGTAKQVWLDWATSEARAFATDEAGKKLWEKVVAKKDERVITVPEAEHLKNLIKARWKELKDAPLPEPLDPQDPWALKVEEIASAEDATAVARELMQAVSDGQMDDTKGRSVAAAIAAKAGEFEQAAA